MGKGVPTLTTAGIVYLPAKKGFVVYRVKLSGERVISHELVTPDGDPEPSVFAASRLKSLVGELVREALEEADR